MNVKIDELADAITTALAEYDAEVTVATKKAVEETAEECRQEIANNAPKHSGKYAKSWRKKLSYYSARDSRYTVYSTRYQLTHLLEYGHEKWVWGYYTGERVDAKPHIRPAEEHASETLIKKIKKELS